MATSNSTGHRSELRHFISENWQFFCMRLRHKSNEDAQIEGIFKDLEIYDKYASMYCSKPLKELRIFEVGYGARPLQLLALIGLGYQAKGIDLDSPMLRLSFSEGLRIFRSNGLRRAVKSVVRSLLFDGGERKALSRALAARGGSLVLDRGAFLVGDASGLGSAIDEQVDFFFSDNVFEHLPSETMDAVLRSMHERLSPNGIVVIVPDVYTGLSGGHLAEWFPDTIGDRSRSRRSEAWGHLTDATFTADCYLNKLRLQDYRDAFSRYFDIVLEESLMSGLGKHLMTAELREKLRDYADTELFCQRVRFVLQPKKLAH